MWYAQNKAGLHLPAATNFASKTGYPKPKPSLDASLTPQDRQQLADTRQVTPGLQTCSVRDGDPGAH